MAAIELINQNWQTEFRPADVGLLAFADTVPEHLMKPLERFKRHDGYRICLTPLMMQQAGDMKKEAN
jgi:hypothetical protein